MRSRFREEKIKRPSTVASSTTYRNMVCQVIEQAPTKALDLHGIYDSLGKLHEQYKDDSIEVDWRVIRLYEYVVICYLYLRF